MEELVEITDSHGRTVDVVPRAQARARRLRYRGALTAVLSPSGRILVHQRAFTKPTMPGWWDLACGGAVDAGEEPSAAARREVEEELGVTVSPVPLAETCWDGERSSLYLHLFTAVCSATPVFVDGEVIAARWVGAAELDRLMAAHRFCPDSVDTVLPRIAGMLSAV